MSCNVNAPFAQGAQHTPSTKEQPLQRAKSASEMEQPVELIMACHQRLQSSDSLQGTWKELISIAMMKCNHGLVTDLLGNAKWT